MRPLLILLTTPLLLAAAGMFLPGWIPSLLEVFSRWVLMPAWILLVASIVAKDRWMTAANLLLVVLHLVRVAPDLASAKAPPEGPSLHIVSANLLMVHPDPLPLAQTLLARDADVLMLQEVSDIWAAALSSSGVLAAYPHQVLQVQNDSFGTAILSRVPLTSASVSDLLGVPYTQATLDLGEETLTLLNIHTLPPRTGDYFQRWRAQMDFLAGQVGDGPLALIGDLNTTQHSGAYRALLRAGLHSSHRECGRGRATTFPNGLFPIPSVRLDHALLSADLGCVSIEEIPQTGSDHSALDLVIGLR